MMDEFLFLVASYIISVRDVIANLQTHLHTTSILDAVRDDPQLRSGTLNSTTTYSFHGAGCRVKVGERTLDFDFGPNGSAGGFDAWRLWLFAEGDPTAFAHWQNLESIDVALRKLHDEGVVTLPKSAPSPHLYYLTSEGERAAMATSIRRRAEVR